MTNRDTSSAPERGDDPNEPLTEAIVGLKDELRVLRMVLDELRSDVQFITRNGISGHETSSSPVRGNRDAVDTHDADGNKNLTHSHAEDPTDPATDDDNYPRDFQTAIDELKDVVTTLAQDQVNMLLSALDQVRDQLVAVIRESSPQQPRSPLLTPLPLSNAATEPAGSTEKSADVIPAKTPQQLF
ncbi:MAG: hypothetical protein HZA46_23305 [Planctomycetales bacterium]|nr:hypothetical protein [Planctomycetales bacterium]